MGDLEQHAAELEAYAQRIEMAVSPLVTTPCMEAVGQQARLLIYKRTVIDGLDRDGQPFPRYSTRRIEIMPDSVYYAGLKGAGRTYRRRGEERAHKARFDVKRRGQKRDKLKGIVFDLGWQQVAQAYGGSAQRDMTMRGDMMGQAANPGFVITAKSGDTVTLDFLNALERLKAEGQHKMFNWWGVGRFETERNAMTAAFLDVWIPYLKGEKAR